MLQETWTRRFCAVAAALALSGLASCAHDAPALRRPQAAAPLSTAATATTAVAPTTVTSAAAPHTTDVTSASVRELTGVTGRQAVTVRASSYAQTTATLRTYERAGSGWRLVAGPWTAFVGRRGIAPAGEKREGDLRVPAGTFGFGFAFGVQPDPGVRLAFRRITGSNIVWDDDPSSALYNEWVDTSQQDAGAKPEPMFTTPAYNLGAVIAYNTARTPGLGSAIFLHVSTGRATAGCVSLPAAQLRSVLLWLDPGASPQIVISAG